MAPAEAPPPQAPKPSERCQTDGDQCQRGQDKGHNREVAGFIEACRTGSPLVPVEELLETSLATLAAQASLVEGRPVNLPSFRAELLETSA